MIRYVVVDAFPVEPDSGKVLLIRKNKPEYLRGIYNLTGGKIEDGETPEQAAVRELKEETGLDELQEYDSGVYYPVQYCGVILGNRSTIHCVQVPVTLRQPLVPGEGETEPVGWFNYTEALNHPMLMPNLRLIVPLVRSGSRGWVIDARDSDWSYENHSLGLTLPGSDDKITVIVKGLAHYEDREL